MIGGLRGDVEPVGDLARREPFGNKAQHLDFTTADFKYYNELDNAKGDLVLPGIAGFVLTMGIGVDSNVLIFERIKEELEAQRGVRASINAGFARVFWTLVDTHIAALI